MEAKPTKLLLVDDETEFLAATGKALTRRGFDVLTAASGDEALLRLADAEVELAVLDVKMPGMDGVTLFKQLRRQFPDLPVVLLTGHGTVGQAFETSRAGVLRYLSKPCEVEALAAIIREVLAERGPRQPVPEPSPGDVRLLIVDDEPELLVSLRAALTRRGFSVFTAGSGEAALVSLAERPCSVILLDLKMPGMAGLELVPRIHAICPSAEVIVLTGQPSLEAAVQGTREGVFDFLGKPQTVEELAARIRAAHRSHLNKEEARRQAEVEAILLRYPD